MREDHTTGTANPPRALNDAAARGPASTRRFGQLSVSFN